MALKDLSTHNKIILSVVLVVLLLCLLFVLYLLTRPSVIKITGAEAAKRGEAFIHSMHRDEGSFFAKRYGEEKGVDFQLKDSSGSPAWEILGLVGLYNISQNPEYLNQINQAFTRMKELSNGPNTMLKLVQLEEAFPLVKNPEMLSFIYERLDYLNFRSLYQSPLDMAIEPMYTAIAAKQNALFAGLLDQPGNFEMLKNSLPDLSFRSPSEMRDSLVSNAKRMIDEAEKGDKQGGVILPDEDFGHDTCWIQAAKASLFKVTGETAYRDEVHEAFRKLGFARRRRDGGRVPLGSLAQVQPCIEVLQQLSTEDEGFREDLYVAIEDYLLSRIDLPERKLCDGDAGFLALGADAGSRRCENDVKAVSDASYSIFLLSKHPEVFSLKIKGK